MCCLVEYISEQPEFLCAVSGGGIADQLAWRSDDGDGAAKIIFDLERKGKALMKMELRFKGGFTSQPQFFGIMTDEFKSVLTNGKCL